MKKGVIYARFSSHNQREESIEQQVEECTAFAAANNISVVEIYADKAITGKTDKRKSFQKMMRDAERRKFDVVIAYKSNRIARNMLNALQYESKLDKLGIDTLYAKEEFGNTASGRFALRTMMNVNQFYSENLSEDVKRGMKSNAEQCKVNGSIPFGFRKSEDGKLEPHPENAPIVREIFDKVLHGEKFIDIARDINSRGIKTRQGNEWNKSSFVRMLRNTVYIGTYHHSGYVFENAIQPLVSKDVFYAVQNKLEERTPYGKNQDYLLTGKIFCGECGSAMVGICGTSRTGQRYYYYACQGKRIEHICRKANESKEDIEFKVAKYTRDIVLEDSFIEWLADAAIAFQKEASKESGLDQLEANKREKEKAIKNILTAIEQGIFTASTKDRLLELENEVAAIRENIEIFKASYKPLDRDRIIFALHQLKSERVEDERYQKMLIKTFIKSVRVFDDRLELDYYYNGKNDTGTAPNSSSIDDSGPPNALSTNHVFSAFTVILFSEFFRVIVPTS